MCLDTSEILTLSYECWVPLSRAYRTSQSPAAWCSWRIAVVFCTSVARLLTPRTPPVRTQEPERHMQWLKWQKDVFVKNQCTHMQPSQKIPWPPDLPSNRDHQSSTYWCDKCINQRCHSYWIRDCHELLFCLGLVWPNGNVWFWSCDSQTNSCVGQVVKICKAMAYDKKNSGNGAKHMMRWTIHFST